MIDTSRKPHAIGKELLLPTIKELLRTVVYHSSPDQISKAIQLRINSVQRRINQH